MKTCSKCKLEKSVDRFSSYNCSRRGKVVIYPWCNECKRQLSRRTSKKWNNLNQPKVRAYERMSREKKRAHIHEHYRIECKKCGERRKYLLDFHHINREEKKFDPLNSYQISLKRIVKEVEKCITLCANCHREFHYFERHENININNYLDEKPDN